MKNIQNLDLDFIQELCTGDLERWQNVEAEGMYINESAEFAGYNNISWYVYIALENGVTICEAFNWVEFLVTNLEDWEEFFFETYEEAEEKLETF